MPYADLPGLRMFYTDVGEGSPVLLVHGLSCDGNDWCYQIPELRKKHRVITADLRGHGRSGVPEAGYNPRQYAKDAAALLKTLNVEPVIAFGHSQGGPAVLHLAVEHPETIRAIVTVDGSYGIPLEARPVFEQMAAGMRLPDGHQVFEDFAVANFYPASCPPHLPAWHMRRMWGIPAHVLSEGVAGLLRGDDSVALLPQSENYLRQIVYPVLCVRANKQRADWERGLLQHSYSRAVGWEGVGHWPHQERPEEFNALSVAWIDGLPE